MSQATSWLDDGLSAGCTAAFHTEVMEPAAEPRQKQLNGSDGILRFSERIRKTSVGKHKAGGTSSSLGSLHACDMSYVEFLKEGFAMIERIGANGHDEGAWHVTTSSRPHCLHFLATCSEQLNNGTTWYLLSGSSQDLPQKSLGISCAQECLNDLQLT